MFLETPWSRPPCLTAFFTMRPSSRSRGRAIDFASTPILTSNRGFSEWGHVFGDPVVATALLDRLLHHATVIQIEGASYRLREHADLDLKSRIFRMGTCFWRPRGRDRLA